MERIQDRLLKRKRLLLFGRWLRVRNVCLLLGLQPFCFVEVLRKVF